jgi:hypothetical protein
MKKLMLLIVLFFISVIAFGQKVSGDTVIINTEKIRFVKIDGEVFEIKRTASIEKVQDKTITVYGDNKWLIDTMFTYPIRRKTVGLY